MIFQMIKVEKMVKDLNVKHVKVNAIKNTEQKILRKRKRLIKNIMKNTKMKEKNIQKNGILIILTIIRKLEKNGTIIIKILLKNRGKNFQIKLVKMQLKSIIMIITKINIEMIFNIELKHYLQQE